jgi:hypothetical protein
MTTLWQLAFALLAFFVVVEGVGLLALARAIGLLQLRLGPEPAALRTSDGLPLQATAPPVSGFDPRLGRPVTLDLSTGRWALVFVGATCGECRDLVRAASRVSKSRGWGARVAVVAQGSHEQNKVLGEIAPGLLLISDPLGDAQQAYNVERTPYAFLVEGGRVQAKGVVNHRDHLEALIERRMTERPEAVWRPVEEALPLHEAHVTAGGRNG